MNSANPKAPYPTKVCLTCGQTFEKPNVYSWRQWESRKYCSTPCGRAKFSETRAAQWEDPAYREAMSAAHRGKPSPFRGKPQLHRRGPAHPSWKGGITPTNHKIRTSLEFKNWRLAVLERDGFRCVLCGVTRDEGAVLCADHIEPFSVSPERRFDLTNGRTLCTPCHRATPTYGGRMRKVLGI